MPAHATARTDHSRGSLPRTPSPSTRTSLLSPQPGSRTRSPSSPTRYAVSVWTPSQLAAGPQLLVRRRDVHELRADPRRAVPRPIRGGVPRIQVRAGGILSRRREGMTHVSSAHGTPGLPRHCDGAGTGRGRPRGAWSGLRVLRRLGARPHTPGSAGPRDGLAPTHAPTAWTSRRYEQRCPGACPDGLSRQAPVSCTAPTPHMVSHRLLSAAASRGWSGSPIVRRPASSPRTCARCP